MKNTKANKINLIFSSFLVIGYIICTYFFSSLASRVSGTLGVLIQVLMLVVFGLLLFFATRVGEGRQVRRFSLAALLLIDLPSLLIILAGLFAFMPLHDQIAAAASVGGLETPSIIMTLACVALGYGIPYTFFSGYELADDEDDEEAPEQAAEPLEGGLAEELAEAEAADETEAEAAEETQAKAEEEAAEKAAEEVQAEAQPEAETQD